MDTKEVKYGAQLTAEFRDPAECYRVDAEKVQTTVVQEFAAKQKKKEKKNHA